MLHINHITYYLEERTLFDQATLTVRDRVKLGLVGRNGSGKSTLFRLIQGEITPHDGQISLHRNCRLGWVEQHLSSDGQSLLDTVLAADQVRTQLLIEAQHASDPHKIAAIHTRLADMEAHRAEARAGIILSGLGFSPPMHTQLCKHFSGGWRMRIALASMLFARPQLLLLDEPTNYLDMEGIIWLETYLRTYSGTVIMISHDRDFLNRACTHIAHLKMGKFKLYTGNYDSFERQLNAQNHLNMALYKKQEDERRQLEAFITRFRAKASKARQAQSRIKRLEKMQPVATLLADPIAHIDLTGPSQPLAPPLVRLEAVSLGYQADTPLLQALNLRIDTQDRIGVLGKNGEGKSTLAKALADKLVPQTGYIKRHKKLTIGYFSQEQIDTLDPLKSAYGHICDLMSDATEAQKRSRLARFGLSRTQADTATHKLSGGEKARLLFSLISFKAPHLLILDEPANHLDMDSRAELIKALNEYTGAILLISHDRNLLDSVVNHFWHVQNGTITPFEDTLEAYQKHSSTPGKESHKIEKKAHKRTQTRRENAQTRQNLAPLKQKYAQIEHNIMQAQKRLTEIDQKLADPKLYVETSKQPELLARERADIKRHIDTLEEKGLSALEAYEQALAETD